jgi:hypothetical protein
MQYETWHCQKEQVDLSLVKKKVAEAVAGKILLTAEVDIGAVDHVALAVIEKK